MIAGKKNGHNCYCTTSLHAALVVHQGEVVGQCASRDGHQEFLNFLRLLVHAYAGRGLHLIVDNLSTHMTCIQRQYQCLS